MVAALTPQAPMTSTSSFHGRGLLLAAPGPVVPRPSGHAVQVLCTILLYYHAGAASRPHNISDMFALDLWSTGSSPCTWFS